MIVDTEWGHFIYYYFLLIFFWSTYNGDKCLVFDAMGQSVFEKKPPNVKSRISVISRVKAFVRLNSFRCQNVELEYQLSEDK